MLDMQPTTPKNLNPLARELLESLAGHPEAAEIVLGGGVALSHYLEYRDTVDVDAWWREQPVAAGSCRFCSGGTLHEGNCHINVTV